MSIFNFIKDVGKKLFENEGTPASARAEQMAEKLREQLKKLDLGIEEPQINIEGDKAVLQGNAKNQEALEKAILAIGNTAGIAQVESKIKLAQAGGAAPNFYTVKKGDTLSKIAKEVYGDANRYNEIFNANRPLLKDPDEIYPGQQLRIPEKQKAAA